MLECKFSIDRWDLSLRWFPRFVHKTEKLSIDIDKLCSGSLGRLPNLTMSLSFLLGSVASRALLWAQLIKYALNTRFKLLGFEVRWIKSRNGRLRPAYNPQLDRMNKRLREIRTYLWENRNAPNHIDVLKNVAAVVRGWVNYFAISDCGPRVWRFTNRVRHLIHKLFNRRGGNRCISWEKVQKILDIAGILEEFTSRSMFPTWGKQTNH